jgi:RNA polymerase sigma factor (sigma-70 family)
VSAALSAWQNALPLTLSHRERRITVALGFSKTEREPRAAGDSIEIAKIEPHPRQDLSIRIRSVEMAVENEAELLARCRRGDSEAWDELFDRHYAAAGRFIFQLGYDLTREDVEEISQEVFLTVIKSLHTFQGNCQFQTWLFRIAANKTHDYRQKQHAAKRGGGQVTLSLHQNSDDPDGFVIDPPSAAPGPDLALIQTENIGLVGQALEQLGGPCQEIIELRYFADLSYDEIARSLELNMKTVSSRLSKCLDKLEAVTKELISRERKSPTSV